jgi:hypothetical protein
MVSYLNTHQRLENRRQLAKETSGQGPRTFVSCSVAMLTTIVWICEATFWVATNRNHYDGELYDIFLVEDAFVFWTGSGTS